MMKHTSINETSLTADMSSIDVSGAGEAETPSPQQGSANLANHSNKAKTAMGALLGLLAFGVGGVAVYSWGNEAASPPHHDLSSNQSLIKQASASRADAEKRGGERTKFSTAEGDDGQEGAETTVVSVFDTNARSLTTACPLATSTNRGHFFLSSEYTKLMYSVIREHGHPPMGDFVFVATKCFTACCNDPICTGVTWRINDRYDDRDHGNCWFFKGELTHTDTGEIADNGGGVWFKEGDTYEGDMVLLGEGMCTRGKHTGVDTSLQFKEWGVNGKTCRAKCLEYSDWCLGVQIDPDGYGSLVTDLETFKAAGYELEKYRSWGGPQTIDGTQYQTYCNADGYVCTEESTAFEGGGLYPVTGWHCWLSPLAKSTAVSSKESDKYLGEGMCTRGNGGFAILKFEQWQGNVEVCRAKCLVEYSDWCLGVEVQATPGNSHCSLVTDLGTFQAAGHTLQNNKWAGAQTIDGTEYMTWCPDESSDNACATVQNTAFEGGGLYERTGWHCWLSPLAKSTELN